MSARRPAEIGANAERDALRFLTKVGFREVTSNFHSKAGEIDLIVEQGDLLVFVEVRFRQDSGRGTPAETITTAKIRRIVRTAEFFVLTHPEYRDKSFRFDVIAITDKIDWIENAFTLDDLH
ncbi:MAG: YraN family protein [Proteobacteria bacterium]|nr:YraN family protein [Pseudomonadota bacterium]